MITSPLLSNVRHRAMIMPVSPLRTKAVELVLKLGAPAPASGINILWLRLQHLELLAPEQFGPKNQRKTLYYYLYSSFAPQIISVDPQSKIQAPDPAPHTS